MGLQKNLVFWFVANVKKFQNTKYILLSGVVYIARETKNWFQVPSSHFSILPSNHLTILQSCHLSITSFSISLFAILAPCRSPMHFSTPHFRSISALYFRSITLSISSIMPHTSPPSLLLRFSFTAPSLLLRCSFAAPSLLVRFSFASFASRWLLVRFLRFSFSSLLVRFASRLVRLSFFSFLYSSFLLLFVTTISIDVLESQCTQATATSFSFVA
jgi:hypothetical protein